MDQNHLPTGLRKNSIISQIQSSDRDSKNLKNHNKERDGLSSRRKFLMILFLSSTLFCVLALFGKKFLLEKDQNEISYQEIPQLICTVKARGEGFRTLKVCLSLEIAGAKPLMRIKNHLPEVQNSLTLFLSSLRTADFESAGFGEILQQELHKRVENLFPGMVRATHIKELLIE